MSAPAWGALAFVVGFVALAAWWLAVDNGVPYNDAAQHLFFSFRYYDLLSEGQVMDVVDFPSFYPPAMYLFGAAATTIGGVHVAVPILAQNLVLAPLLALACYRIARMLGGPTAGLLAVVFALGGPLIIEQFHVFMLDAPQATFVALTVWGILASDRFERMGPSALAGLALGIGVASKSLAPLYLVGFVAIVLARGGWRNWRGLLAFGAVAAAVGAPWYLRQIMLGEGGRLLRAAGPGGDVPPLARPELATLDNWLWYFWATLDGLLFAPLFVLAAVGIGAAVARVIRARPREDLTLELLGGLAGAWLFLTVMPHKDMRYTVSLIVFIAVLGTVWMVRLARVPRALAITVLCAAVVSAHIGATFGVGGETSRQLPGSRRAAYGEGVPPRNRVIVYSNQNFIVSGPRREPDVLGFLEVVRRQGVMTIGFADQVESYDRHFEEIGMWVFARVLGMQVFPSPEAVTTLAPGQAIMIRRWPAEGSTPCLPLADGSGVWVRIGTAEGGTGRTDCPVAS